MKNFLLFILLLTSSTILAQSSYNIQFQEESVAIDENIHSFQWDQMPASSKFQNGYYGWIQFYETPKQAVQNNLKNRGLELIEYLPHRAYAFYFPENTSIEYLKEIGVRAIVPIQGQYKLSPDLKIASYPDYALDGNNILVTLQLHNHVNLQYAYEELAKQKVRILQEYKGQNIIDLSISENAITTLSNLPFVK